MMLNDLNMHFITVTTVKISLLAKRYVVSAVISHTSFLSVKGLLLSLSREVDALRCALHHFRLADETAQGAFSLCVCQRGGELGEKEGKREHH